MINVSLGIHLTPDFFAESLLFEDAGGGTGAHLRADPFRQTRNQLQLLGRAEGVYFLRDAFVER